MNIVQHHAAKTYSNGYVRDVADVTEVVVHGTGGGASADAMWSWMLKSSTSERRARWARGIGLYHYLIDREGVVYQLLDHDRWAYHSSSGAHDTHTIGVELLQPDWYNKGEYTYCQYSSLSNLFEYLTSEMPTIGIVTSHRRNYELYSGGTKNCPGPRFDWDRLVMPEGVRIETADGER